jgi:hypothetical protein
MEQNKNMTAVELFIAELKKWDIHSSTTNYTFKVPLNVFIRMEMEAKQMEEEQHGNTWLNGQVNVGIKKTFQQYYNETYSTQEK